MINKICFYSFKGNKGNKIFYLFWNKIKIIEWKVIYFYYFGELIIYKWLFFKKKYINLVLF